MDTGYGITAQKEIVPSTLQHKRTHVGIFGKTGQGKSVLIENMIFDDLAAGRGLTFLDPHGTSAIRIADCIPPERINDVIYFDPTDPHCPAFNPLETDNPSLTAEQILTTIHNIWPDSWGPNLEYLLLNDIRLLQENPGTTLLDLKKPLVNAAFRDTMLSNVKDADLRSIWEQEFAPKYNARNDHEWRHEIQSTLNKVGRFTSVPTIRTVLRRPATIGFREIMEEGKILICNLSVGKLGRGPARLIGAFIVSGFTQAAERRIWRDTLSPNAEPVVRSNRKSRLTERKIIFVCQSSPNAPSAHVALALATRRLPLGKRARPRAIKAFSFVPGN